MHTHYGFSLTEVLVSLLLLTSSSLALLKHQWQVEHLFNQLFSRTATFTQFDNHSERFIKANTLKKANYKNTSDIL